MALRELVPQQNDTIIVRPKDCNSGDVMVAAKFREAKTVRTDNGDTKLYLFDKGEEEYGIWGTKVLDSIMELAEPGQQLVVTYKGVGKASGGKNPPHLFKVEVDEEEMF